MFERLYYTVPQLAQHWGMTADDVLQLGFTSQLKFHALADWTYPAAGLVFRGEHTKIKDGRELSNIYFAPDTFFEKGFVNFSATTSILQGDKCTNTYFPGMDRLIIQAEEVERFEKKNDFKKIATPFCDQKNTIKRKSVQRERGDLRLLIDGYLGAKDIKEDKKGLSDRAWQELISGDFKSEYIANVKPEELKAKQEITTTDGKSANVTKFKVAWRSLFECKKIT